MDVQACGDSVETKVKLITDKEVKGVKKGGGNGMFRSNREHVRYMFNSSLMQNSSKDKGASLTGSSKAVRAAWQKQLGVMEIWI